MKPESREEVAKVQRDLLSYSDDAEEKIKRAMAGQAPLQVYDLKLYQEILRSMPGHGSKNLDQAAFE
jgi:hypothetical protein